MKLPYSWLKELLPDLPPVSELEPVFAHLGLPLEGVEEVPAPVEGVLLVAVKAAEPIEGTQLTRLTLDTGENGEKTIASGAPPTRWASRRGPCWRWSRPAPPWAA